jgi:DNA processing protein
MNTSVMRSPAIRVLAPVDDDYPRWLRSIVDHPAVLHVRGRLLPGRRCVACVGTRQPSAFGQVAAREISRFLAARGWSVVSGLALGVDTICHEAALEAGGHTVAVLANGLDSVYPRQNRALAERILAAGGALVSEQPPGTPALPRHLVARDRLQSGMSAATIVMQTDLTGGSMHTVRYALLQGRRLVVPVPRGADAEEPKSRGILALTRRTGSDLARLIGARGGYAELLTRRFADRPAATPLAGRGGCGEFLDVLESLIADDAKQPAHQLALQLI